MKKGKLLGKDIEVVIEYLSDNLVYVKQIEGNQKESIILINDSVGEAIGYDSPKWNLKIEENTHFVISSFSIEQFEASIQKYKSLKE